MNVPNTRGYIQSRQALMLLLVVMTCSMLGLLLVTTYAQDPTVQSAQTSSGGESGGSPCSGGANGSSSLCVTKDCVRKFCNSVTQGALNVDSVSLSSDTILLGTSQVSANFMNGTSSASIQNAEVNINVTCTTTTYGDSDGDGDLEVVDTLVNPKEDSDFVVPVNATYTWTFTGGNDLITGNGTSATIDTSTLTAGSYVVTCRADLSLDDSVTFSGKQVPCAQLVQATYIKSATLTIVDVTVTYQDPEGVALPSPLIIPTGDSASIQALIDPESAMSEVSFVSDAPGIATVSVGSTSGDTIALTITGVAEGSTTIIAKVGGQEVATLAVSVEDIVWELTYWSVGGGGGGAGTNSAMSMSMSSVTLNEAGAGGGEGAQTITEGATITVPADDPTAFQYEGKGNLFQNWFASCTITWPEGFTVVDDGDDNDETSTATRAFSAGSHSITVTASWSFLKVLSAGTKSTSATVNAISVSMLSCEGVDSTESSPQTVTIPLNHNNGSVDITATLSGTAPSGKPVWSGVTSSNGLTATLDTSAAGVYAVSAECGNTVPINVEVVEVSKLSCEGVDSTESSPQIVRLPLNHNNGSVTITATLSGTAPIGKPVWSGTANSNGLTATLDTNSPGVYSISAECGNTVTMNVEVGALLAINDYPEYVPINQTPVSISASFTDSTGSPITGEIVTFSSTALLFTESNTAITDGNGIATISTAKAIGNPNENGKISASSGAYAAEDVNSRVITVGSVTADASEVCVGGAVNLTIDCAGTPDGKWPSGHIPTVTASTGSVLLDPADSGSATWISDNPANYLSSYHDDVDITATYGTGDMSEELTTVTVLGVVSIRETSGSIFEPTSNVYYAFSEQTVQLEAKSNLDTEIQSFDLTCLKFIIMNSNNDIIKEIHASSQATWVIPSESDPLSSESYNIRAVNGKYDPGSILTIIVAKAELLNPVDANQDGKVNDFGSSADGTGNVFEFTDFADNPARCSVPIRVKITPDTPEFKSLLEGKVTVTVSEISNGEFTTSLLWTSETPDNPYTSQLEYSAGAEGNWTTTAVYEGLPEPPQNSLGRVPKGARELLYGVRTATVRIAKPTGASGYVWTDSKPYEVFYGGNLVIDGKRMAETTENYQDYIGELVSPGDVHREIYEKMNCSTEGFVFESLAKAKENFLIRTNAIENMKRMNDNTFDSSWMDPYARINGTFYDDVQQTWSIGQYWRPYPPDDPQTYFFVIKDGTPPHDAVSNTFPFRGECLGASDICILLAVKQAVGESDYNAIYQGVSGATPSVGEGLNALHHPLEEVYDHDTYIPGDSAYMNNHNYRELITGKHWQGENCIVMGENSEQEATFQGFGVGRLTEEGLRTVLAGHYREDTGVTEAELSEHDLRAAIEFTYTQRLVKTCDE